MSEPDLSKASLSQLKREAKIDNLDERLTDWFRRRLHHHKDVQLQSLKRTSGEGGMSAEMFIAELQWRDGDSGKTVQKKYVVRAEFSQPTNPASNSSHMIAALKQMSRHTDLPIPGILGAEHDPAVIGGRFSVMEFIDGRIAPDSPPYTASGWVKESTEDQVNKMFLSGIRFLSDLHAADWEAMGLDFLLHTHEGISQTEWVLGQATAIYDEAVDGKRRDLEQATIDWLKQHRPEREQLVICWGDSRPGNILWKDFELSGALDWEMVTLLDPSYDVALWIFTDTGYTESCGISRLPGMLEKDAFIHKYEEFAGYTLKNYDYYELLCAFRSHAVVAHMVATWERNGQHFFGEGMGIENNPMALTYAQIARQRI